MATDSMMAELRGRVDFVDAVIVRIISERARLVDAIGRVKAVSGVEIFQPDREAEVLNQARRLALEGPLAPEAMARIVEQIIAECKKLETAERMPNEEASGVL